jgi:hypothetical protein
VKKIIISASTVGAAGVAIGALGLFGAGVASAAPDVVGMTYGDAVSQIEDGGGTAKISVTVGDRQDAMGDCLVTNASDSPFIADDGGTFTHADGVVLLALNCNRGVATAGVPGASAASPEGRAFQAKAEEAAAAQQNEGDELADAGATPGVARNVDAESVEADAG